MKKNLMMFLVLASCTGRPAHKSFTPTFRILPNEKGENMACMDSNDTQKVFEILNRCEQRGER